MKFISKVTIGFVAMAAMAGSAISADFPSQTVRIVVPYGPGGGTDLIARVLADQLGRQFGVPVIVENRPGAFGATAMEQVRQADPDGHTMILHNVTTAALTPIAYSDRVPFDIEASFKPVTLVAQASTAYVASLTSTPSFESLEEVAEWSRANPGRVRYGNAGMYSIGHLDGLVISQSMGSEFSHIPATGGASGTAADIVNGDLHITGMNEANALNLIEGGHARLLAGKTPLKSFPDTPTLQDLGFRGVGQGNWQMLFVPAETPDEVTTLIHEAVLEALEAEETLAQLEQLYNVPVSNESPQAAQEWLDNEIETMRGQIESIGITFE